jgi:hypothetical protein
MPTGLHAPSTTKALWNWEFSATTKAGTLTAYDYYIVMDYDPSTGESNVTVNALTFWSDNSYGDASTANGAGQEGPASTYAASSTVFQQSQNIGFYPTLGYDPTIDATYTFSFYAVPAGAGPNGARVATVGMTVVVGAGGPPAPDDDQDGVPNSMDYCPGTLAGESVDVQGCSVQDFVRKCEAENPSNHGEYVSCVAETATRLYKAGIITQKARGEMVSIAARSDIGKGDSTTPPPPPTSF